MVGTLIGTPHPKIFKPSTLMITGSLWVCQGALALGHTLLDVAFLWADINLD